MTTVFWHIICQYISYTLALDASLDFEAPLAARSSTLPARSIDVGCGQQGCYRHEGGCYIPGSREKTVVSTPDFFSPLVCLPSSHLP